MTSAPEHLDPALRVEALASLLTERGLIDEATIETFVKTYEQSVGPMNGATVVAKAWTDPGYRARLLADGTAAIAELGFKGPQGEHMVVLENTPTRHHVVVCTLCSPCGPLKPSSAIAAVPSASSRARYSGSVHALATTLAPFIGPTDCS